MVDDNSPDGTGDVADELASCYSNVHVLHRPFKQGLGRAYCAGFAWALERDYEFICEMDADLSHDPADVPGLIEAARGADLAIGSRYVDGGRVVNWPKHRRWLSRGASLYVRILTGLPVRDPTAGFRCFRRETLERLEVASLRSDGYAFQIEVAHRVWRNGGRIVEVPITFVERTQGRSKMSHQIVREAIFCVGRLAVQLPHRLSPMRRAAAAQARAAPDTHTHM